MWPVVVLTDAVHAVLTIGIPIGIPIGIDMIIARLRALLY